MKVRVLFRGSLSIASLLIVALAGCGRPGVELTAEEKSRLEERSIDFLTRASQAEDPIVRANAIESLVKFAPEQSRPQFLAAADADLPVVRYAGLLALGQIRDHKSLGPIRRRLVDQDSRVRMAAAFAAYRCGDVNTAGPILDSALRDNPDEKLRGETAWLIGRLGDTTAIARLRKVADRDSSGLVVTYAQSAMSLLGDQAMIDRLIEYTLKSDVETRLIALQTLVETPEPRARKALLYRLNDASDYLATRLLAARALGAAGDGSGYKLAYESLGYRNSEPVEMMRVRSMAALALGAVGDPRALGALRTVAESDTDPRTQVAACDAILQIIRRPRPR